MKKEKSKTQKFLEQDEFWAVQIECLLAEKDQWQEMALRITSSMGEVKVQSTGSRSKLEEAVTLCTDAEAEILQGVRNLVDQRKKLKEVLGRLDNPTWYKLLHMRYIQRYSLNEIADKFNASYDWAKCTHGRALKAVQGIMEQ